MTFWPFKKKVVEEVVEEQVEKEPETITITANDDGMRRAEVAMRMAGFVINRTLYNQLPAIAEVFEKYKQLDYAAGVNSRKRKKPKNTYCPGCKRYLDEIKKDGCGSQRCPDMTEGPSADD